jgi:alpha-beta hydrolase superfamily lysophospholipase
MHHQVSARLFLALQDAGRRALERAAEFTYPVLLLHGGADLVTCSSATREFYERAASADKKFVLYPDFLHETHNELGRERVLEDAARWIEERV